MKTITTYCFITIILFTSCRKKEDINDISKRNEKWAWTTDLEDKNGKWVPIGKKTTIEKGKHILFDCNGRLNESGKILNFLNADTTIFYNLRGIATKEEISKKETLLKWNFADGKHKLLYRTCLLYTSPSPRDGLLSRMPSSA